MSSSFTQLAILANVAALTMYLMCVAGSYELQRRDVRAGGTPFAVPAGPLIPLLAAGVIVWMLSHATRREFAVEGLVLTAASLVYLVRKRAPSEQLAELRNRHFRTRYAGVRNSDVPGPWTCRRVRQAAS